MVTICKISQFFSLHYLAKNLVKSRNGFHDVKLVKDQES